MKKVALVSISGHVGSNGHWPNVHSTAWLIAIVGVLALTPTTSLAKPSSHDGIWTMTGQEHDPARQAGPRKYSRHIVNEERLREQLQKAPLESSQRTSDVVITVPMPDGSFERVALEESSIFSPELQAQYPEMRTYRGIGVDDPGIQGRLDFTPAGFHAMLFTDDGVVFVDPAQRGETSTYISYWKADMAGENFECDVDGATGDRPLAGLLRADNPAGAQLRTYRLAVSVTGEYTQFFGKHARGIAGKIPQNAAAAQITTTVNRVTGIYEQEVAIRLNLVATRIFTDPQYRSFSTSLLRSALRESNNAGHKPRQRQLRHRARI